MMSDVTSLERWSHIYYADADYGDAMAGAIAVHVEHVSRTQRAAAVYRRRGPEGAAHYYFAPGAGQVGRRFFARPCAEPLPAQRGELMAGRGDDEPSGITASPALAPRPANPRS